MQTSCAMKPCLSQHCQWTMAAIACSKSLHHGVTSSHDDCRLFCLNILVIPKHERHKGPILSPCNGTMLKGPGWSEIIAVGIWHLTQMNSLIAYSSGHKSA